MVERGVEKKKQFSCFSPSSFCTVFHCILFSLFIIVLSQASKRVLHMRGW